MAPCLAYLPFLASCGGDESSAVTDSGADADSDTDSDSDGGTGEFTIWSPAFADGDMLPVQFTCDGEEGGVSPPLDWSGVPTATAELALLVTTMSVDGLKWNWVRYSIPGDVTGLPEGGGGIGTDGLSSDGPLLQYYPPCPHGPGPKTYDFTLYTLSEAPELSVPVEEVDGQIVTDAIAAITLDSCKITVWYEEDDPDGGV
jgi:hypothetical protein